MNIFDFDGVTSIGLHPRSTDVIVTGRSFEECEVIYSYMRDNNFSCPVYFNPISLEKRETGTEKSRLCSASHKSKLILMFLENSAEIDYIFEDDPFQLEIIRSNLPESLRSKVVLIDSNLGY